ncbi:MAG: sugar phosphate isomerase/epimerase family protein [Acutalibacteraceae bacterium]|jgi:sugar phosphate isomerase/epimerase
MRTGICTTDLCPRTAEKLFKKLKELETPVTQFNFGSVTEAGFIPDGQIDIPDTLDISVLRKIKDCSAEYAIEVAVINGTFNMAHPLADVRKEGLRRFKKLCQAADFLDCRLISLCSGTRNTKSLWADHPDNRTKAAWDDMEETVTKAVKLAEKYKITIAVETEASNVIDTPEKARRLMDSIGSDYLKMIMDCANLFHRGEAKKENAQQLIRHAFDVFGKDVVVAHGKDIKEGPSFEFCGPGEGIVDFELFVRLLQENGYAGDMFLHGIEREEKIPESISFFKDVCKKTEV